MRSRNDHPRLSHSSLKSGEVTAISLPSHMSPLSRNMANMSLGMHMTTLSNGRVR
ncbi:MAG: hypothetical protein IKQ60_02945 [Candidatus Methanomethylophilaceae archaeon]|nr:hypothetical protein [Candidatus Methanomethylophilaceae archaeon]